MKIRVDGTYQRITFDPLQDVYIGVQCLDFSACPAVGTLSCAGCPFQHNTEINLDDIIQVYLRSVQEDESN